MTKLSEAIAEKDHHLGLITAPVSLVIYGDYQCQACKMTFPIIKQLQKELGGNLSVVFRLFPLKTSHPIAFEAAKAAEAAGNQNKFWEMHHLIFSRQRELSSHIWEELATELQLDMEKFREDFKSKAIEEKIDKSFMSGVRSGVSGTPCFFINGSRFDDDASYESLKSALQPDHR